MVQGTDVPLKLPSEQIYARIEKDEGCPTQLNNGEKFKENVENRFKTVLQKHGINEGNFASEIAEGWCNAYRMWRDRELPGYVSRHFFYYWLGDKIKDNLGSNNFSDVMGAIYNKLPGNEGVDKFRNLYNDIIWDTFKNRKTLYDYDYDYKKLKQQAQSAQCPWEEELGKNFDGAIKAHEGLGTACVEGDPSNYCNGFRTTDKGTKKQQEPQTLKCTSVSKVEEEEEEDEDEEDEDSPDDNLLEEDNDDDEVNNSGEDPLSKLPSRVEYDKLDQNSNVPAGRSNYAQEVKTEFDGAGVDGTTSSEIVNALWYVSEGGGKDLKKTDNCKFFYFWMGKMLYKTLDHDKVKDTMDKCKRKIFSRQEEHECEFIIIPEKRRVFWALMRLFDFYKDKDSMEGHLGEEGKSCSNAYCSYLQKAQCAYRIMKRACTKGSSQECDQFNKMYGQCGTSGYTGSQCKVTNAPGDPCKNSSKPEASEFPTLDDFSPASMNPTNTIVSCALAAISLPALALFLYKYTSLPSLISNNFGSNNSWNRRKKRSTGPNFSTFTDDSSTEYSTLYSTEASTTASSTEDHSTIYNVQQQGRERTKSRDEQRRKNIGYNPI